MVAQYLQIQGTLHGPSKDELLVSIFRNLHENTCIINENSPLHSDDVVLEILAFKIGDSSLYVEDKTDFLNAVSVFWNDFLEEKKGQSKTLLLEHEIDMNDVSPYDPSQFLIARYMISRYES
jgi:hypothetical protein